MNQKSWNKFIAENSSPSSFLQSWQWGEFQEALGNKVYRLEIGEDLLAQIVVKKLPLGRSYLEIPKGPVADESRITNHELWRNFADKLKEIGGKEKAVLARMNPPYSILSSPLRGEDKGEGDFQKPEILVHQTEPEDTILVDLSKSEDELLANMHEKSRYNIRLAQRKDVKVRIATSDKQAFEKFLDLLEETTKRDQITSWPRERFWKFRERFFQQSGTGSQELGPRAELLVGELEGKILAAVIIMLFGNTSTYLYAASSAENRPANAPSLVLWEAILESKRHGKRWYDMWGVAPKDAGQSHPWAGITMFKTRYVKVGVTGKDVRNIGARDLVLDQTFFTLFKLAKKLHP